VDLRQASQSATNSTAVPCQAGSLTVPRRPPGTTSDSGAAAGQRTSDQCPARWRVARDPLNRRAEGTTSPHVTPAVSSPGRSTRFPPGTSRGTTRRPPPARGSTRRASHVPRRHSFPGGGSQRYRSLRMRPARGEVELHDDERVGEPVRSGPRGSRGGGAAHATSPASATRSSGALLPSSHRKATRRPSGRRAALAPSTSVRARTYRRPMPAPYPGRRQSPAPACAHSVSSGGAGADCASVGMSLAKPTTVRPRRTLVTEPVPRVSPDGRRVAFCGTTARAPPSCASPTRRRGVCCAATA